MHAARLAARLESELGIEAEKIWGEYGEFRVVVDEEEIARAGPGAAIGILPRIRGIVAKVRERL